MKTHIMDSDKMSMINENENECDEKIQLSASILSSSSTSSSTSTSSSSSSIQQQSYISVLVSETQPSTSTLSSSSSSPSYSSISETTSSASSTLSPIRHSNNNQNNSLVIIAAAAQNQRYQSPQTSSSSVFLTPPDTPPTTTNSNNGIINTPFDNNSSKKNKNFDINDDNENNNDDDNNNSNYQIEFLKKRKLDEKEKFLVISGHANFPWSKISYTPTSIRELEPVQKKINSFILSERIDEYLQKFPKNPKEIAITGITGSGKTTLAHMFENRKYVKVNNLNPSITKGCTYNILPQKCLDYIFTNATTTFNRPVVWDRTMYDNFVFYLVHFLMGYYKDTAVTSNYKQIIGLMLEWAHSVNLNKTISFMKTIKRIPQIFIISSDINLISKSLFFRNDTINNVSYSIDYNYLMCQHHALRFFAETLNDFIIDFNQLDMTDIKTLSDLQAFLVYKLDYDTTSDVNVMMMRGFENQEDEQQQYFQHLSPQQYQNKINLNNDLVKVETLITEDGNLENDAAGEITKHSEAIDDDFFCYTPNPLIYDELDLFNNCNLIYKLSKK